MVYIDKGAAVGCDNSMFFRTIIIRRIITDDTVDYLQLRI